MGNKTQSQVCLTLESMPLVSTTPRCLEKRLLSPCSYYGRFAQIKGVVFAQEIFL
jgi:hypothetical protein